MVFCLRYHIQYGAYRQSITLIIKFVYHYTNAICSALINNNFAVVVHVSYLGLKFCIWFGNLNKFFLFAKESTSYESP